jgi:hypothetical protein
LGSGGHGDLVGLGPQTLHAKAGGGNVGFLRATPWQNRRDGAHSAAQLRSRLHAQVTAMSKQAVIRVSNSFTREEIRILKDIIDTATTQEFRGRNHLMKYIERPSFSQLYRKLASMQEKADSLHAQARVTGKVPDSH